MFKKIKILSLAVCSGLLLQACHDDDYVSTADAPKQVLDVGSSVLKELRTNSTSADTLFRTAALVSGRTTSLTDPGGDSGTEPCQVKLLKMAYDTVGGAGEPTTSTGVVMVPYSADPSSDCNGPKPVVLYAHGTTADRDYDLSKTISDLDNPANSAGILMLATYATEGYVVIAPNYAGYADSALSYHPYLDETQQSTEMLNALDHVRENADAIGANLSSKLFLTGISQGGYVALAALKALEARNETVTASVPISGPYALGDFLDDILVNGNVGLGATTFAPMYLTSQRARSIYNGFDQIYNGSLSADIDYDNPLPAPGVSEASEAGLPASALFNSGTFPPVVNSLLPAAFAGYGYDPTDYLLDDNFVNEYRAAYNGVQTSTAAKRGRDLAHAGDLTVGWSPASPVTLCGSENDPVVDYSVNTGKAVTDLAGVNSLNLDGPLTQTPTTATVDGINALIQMQWSSDSVTSNALAIHSSTAVYCGAASLGLFNSLK